MPVTPGLRRLTQWNRMFRLSKATWWDSFPNQQQLTSKPIQIGDVWNITSARKSSLFPVVITYSSSSLFSFFYSIFYIKKKDCSLQKPNWETHDLFMKMSHHIWYHNQCYYIFYIFLINFSLIISFLCQQTTYLPAKMIPVDLLKFSSPTFVSPNTRLTLAHSSPILYCLCLQAKIVMLLWLSYRVLFSPITSAAHKQHPQEWLLTWLLSVAYLPLT